MSLGGGEGIEEQAREGMEEGPGEEEEYLEKIRDHRPGGAWSQEGTEAKRGQGPGGTGGQEGPGSGRSQEGTRGARAVRRGGTRVQPGRRRPRKGGGWRCQWRARLAEAEGRMEEESGRTAGQ